MSFVSNVPTPQMQHSDYGNDINKYAQGMQNQYANPNAQGQTAQGQAQLTQMLQDQAAGKGPSVAKAILDSATAQNAANTNAFAAGQRGNANAALNARNAMTQNNQNNQAAANQAMIGRQAEQLNAQGLLAQNLANTRQQDLMNNQGYNQLQQNYAKMAMGADQGNLQSILDTYRINAGIDATNMGPMNAAIGGAANGAGAAAMKSAGFSQGGLIPGHAHEKGDSSKNDTFPAMLSPGEGVIPRSSMRNPEMATAFINHLMKNRSPNKENDAAGYTKVLESNRRLSNRLAQLEKLLIHNSKKGKK